MRMRVAGGVSSPRGVEAAATALISQWGSDGAGGQVRQEARGLGGARSHSRMDEDGRREGRRKGARR
jgi:hypothetical protein